MNVQVLVIGGDLNVEVFEDGPLLAITVRPGSQVTVEKTGQGIERERTVFHGSGMQNPFGYEPDDN